MPGTRRRHSDHAWRIHGEGDGVEVTGSLGDLAAYLVGRPATGLATASGEPVPELGRWV